jgi:hypothetical protein
MSSTEQELGIDEKELASLAPWILPLLTRGDSAASLLSELRNRVTPDELALNWVSSRVWELAGLWHKNRGRFHEALALFWEMYQRVLSAQSTHGYLHKGLPLVYMADCFGALQFPVHAKRYLMLTLCEDAIRGKGDVSPQETGIYFRLVWGQGVTDAEVRQYARRFYELSQQLAAESLYPEALLQRLDQAWITAYPSPSEASRYLINQAYAQQLLQKLGDKTGEALELLSEYLMSCMPGCRTTRRGKSGSTDYDVICSMEGFDVDFRSELGRYFVCECKDWKKPADFTAMAKLCRVLDPMKSRFGVIFSKQGITGAGRSTDAGLEQLKVFQDRGMVIVVIDEADIRRVVDGANFIQLLRERYEAVRLDLRGKAGAAGRKSKKANG